MTFTLRQLYLFCKKTKNKTKKTTKQKEQKKEKKRDISRSILTRKCYFVIKSNPVFFYFLDGVTMGARTQRLPVSNGLSEHGTQHQPGPAGFGTEKELWVWDFSQEDSSSEAQVTLKKPMDTFSPDWLSASP